MQFWVDTCDIDGFRCDMAMLVPLDFWREARMVLDRQKPLYWLAECEDVAYHAVFDTSYTWKFLHAMEDYEGKYRQNGWFCNKCCSFTTISSRPAPCGLFSPATMMKIRTAAANMKGWAMRFFLLPFSVVPGTEYL